MRVTLSSQRRTTRTLIAVAVALAVAVCIVAARRARKRADDPTTTATPTAVLPFSPPQEPRRATPHNTRHTMAPAPTEREMLRGLPSTHAWPFTVGNVGYTRHLHPISWWYTPPDQPFKTNLEPLGKYSLQLYANGSLGPLSLVMYATPNHIDDTIVCSGVMMVSVRLAAMTMTPFGNANKLGATGTAWVHNVPMVFTMHRKSVKVYNSVNVWRYVCTVKAAANAKNDAPVLYDKAASPMSDASIGPATPRAQFTVSVASETTQVLRAAFNTQAAAFWGDHLYTGMPAFQWANAKAGSPLLSLGDVYSKVANI
uniref:Uncharacterized protein n=1 Tax=viral metagenome TaxID=1070528 RepID=A0A6C0AUL4_9ZZZZ